MPKAPDTRTPNNPWPEWPKICKTDYGQEEAIALFGSDPRIYTTTVKEFIGDKAGNLKKAVCCKLESKKDEKTGRMMMVPIEGSEFTLDVDVVLIAAGFLLHLMPGRADRFAQRLVSHAPLVLQIVMAAAMIWCVMQVKSSDIQPFIYFQF